MKQMIPFCTLFMMLLMSTNSPAADWAQFRGAGGNAVAPESTIPTKWDDKTNITWKTELPGFGASSPIVHGDRVFLTTFSGYGLDPENPGEKAALKLHVLSFDRTTGKLLWDRSIAASEDEQALNKRIIDHGYATGTPATDGKAVFAFFGVSGLVAFDWEGNQLWHQKLGSKTAGFGSAASPILHGDLVIMNASIESDSLFAFDKKTGEERWKVEGINRAWTTPSIGTAPDGTAELIVNQKDFAFGFDPLTGKKLWTCAGIQDYVVPTVVTHEGVAYCLGGRSNRCMAIKLGGRGDVTKSHKLWEATFGANVTSPVYYDGHLYWTSDKGIAFCVNAKTGEEVYRNRIPTRSRIYASIVLAGDKLLVSTRDQGILVLETGPEYKEVAHNVLANDDYLLNASPAISNNQLFLRTNGWLYCISEKK